MADHEPRPTRRIVFHGLGALGVAVALAGCGSDDAGSTEPAPDPSKSSGGGSGGGTETGKALTTTSKVPVGGGVILPDQKIVITQPTAGQFDAFSAVCTHQGFLVTSVEDGTITCNHHGSEYDAKTGAVTQGPAPAGLQKVGIVVKGGKILAT
jgi:Rieske Fe-S protein